MFQAAWSSQEREISAMNLKSKLFPFFRKSETAPSEQYLKEMISDSKDQKIITADEEELLNSIFELEDTRISEIMVPRVDMKICKYDAELTDIIEMIKKTGKSRIPVYHNKFDNIIGIIYAKDVLKFYASDSIRAVEILRKPYFVPETKSVLSALRDFQKYHVSIAVVIDEYGGVAGLITMEDIIEEIVGEVQDELDKEDLMVNRLSENTFLVNARMDLDDFNEKMNTHFEYEDVNSVAGLILTELQHIPRINEKLTLDGMEFQIVDILKNRIQKILVRDMRRAK